MRVQTLVAQQQLKTAHDAHRAPQQFRFLFLAFLAQPYCNRGRSFVGVGLFPKFGVFSFFGQHGCFGCFRCCGYAGCCGGSTLPAKPSFVKHKIFTNELARGIFAVLLQILMNPSLQLINVFCGALAHGVQVQGRLFTPNATGTVHQHCFIGNVAGFPQVRDPGT